MADDDYYRISLDGNWSLNDLYEFPHSYAQNYAFIYCLDTNLDPRDRERINLALENYPWKGGYSPLGSSSQVTTQLQRFDET
jgi:hypothetical protein